MKFNINSKTGKEIEVRDKVIKLCEECGTAVTENAIKGILDVNGVDPKSLSQKSLSKKVETLLLEELDVQQKLHSEEMTQTMLEYARAN